MGIGRRIAKLIGALSLMLVATWAVALISASLIDEAPPKEFFLAVVNVLAAFMVATTFQFRWLSEAVMRGMGPSWAMMILGWLFAAITLGISFGIAALADCAERCGSEDHATVAVAGLLMAGVLLIAIQVIAINEATQELETVAVADAPVTAAAVDEAVPAETVDVPSGDAARDALAGADERAVDD